ncbi:multicilin [Brachyhypopomus gauderio]|uniref:multicilin n=1 Tax=Brachyhypopomus gauderio TaxID=698409 RepID=UPI0040413021
MQTCYYTHLPYLEQENGSYSGDESSLDITFDFASASWTEQPVRTASSEAVALEAVELDSVLQLNRELHFSLQRKQEEISALKLENEHLKDQAKQTHFNIILHAFTLQAEEASVCVSHQDSAQTTRSHKPGGMAAPWCFTPSEQPRLSSLRTNIELEGGPHPAVSPSTGAMLAGDRVRRQLWPSHHIPSPGLANSPWGEDPWQIDLSCSPDAKRLKFQQELHELASEQLQGQSQQDLLQSTGEPSLSRTPPPPQLPSMDAVRVFGAFHGIQVVTATQPINSDLRADCREEEGVCFKTSIKEHSTIRTRVFPHGKTFTSHTPDGGCRFLWFPCEK